MLKCADDTIYTGITTDIDRRLYEHNESELGAKYTKARRPVILIHKEVYQNRAEASKREAEIKKMSRSDKMKLHRSMS